jgi:hypothetical protein
MVAQPDRSDLCRSKQNIFHHTKYLRPPTPAAGEAGSDHDTFTLKNEAIKPTPCYTTLKDCYNIHTLANHTALKSYQPLYENNTKDEVKSAPNDPSDGYMAYLA